MSKVIIGLGNPGEEYEGTRHNIGYLFLDFLAEENWEMDKSLDALVSKAKLEIKGKSMSVVLVKPQVFVNTSGVVAAKVKTVLKAKPEDIIIAQDDLDIPFGNMKLSFDRNSGGHKGIDSIIKALKTKKFWRLRLGIQNLAYRKAHQESEKIKNEKVRDLVLSKFSKKEIEELKDLFKEGLGRLAQK